MATHGKVIYKTDVKGILNGNDLSVGVYGLFNTDKALWDYFIISWITNSSGSIVLTDDLCSMSYSRLDANYEYIRRFGKIVQTAQDGEKFCNDFKVKWESGSNNTTAEIRDKKLDELLK